MIHPNSTRTKHFLAIADFYDRIGKPQTYIVEPNLKYDYRPDVYMEYKGEHVVVEIQLTHISTKRMQEKVDMWISGYGEKHHAKIMWVVTDVLYKLEVPSGFDIQFHQWTKETREIPIP
jgi:competence CoiA-like predicted nuclease